MEIKNLTDKELADKLDKYEQNLYVKEAKHFNTITISPQYIAEYGELCKEQGRREGMRIVEKYACEELKKINKRLDKINNTLDKRAKIKRED